MIFSPHKCTGGEGHKQMPLRGNGNANVDLLNVRCLPAASLQSEIIRRRLASETPPPPPQTCCFSCRVETTAHESAELKNINMKLSACCSRFGHTKVNTEMNGVGGGRAPRSECASCFIPAAPPTSVNPASDSVFETHHRTCKTTQREHKSVTITHCGMCVCLMGAEASGTQ